MNDGFAADHRVGFCKVPENLNQLPTLCVGERKFTAPATVPTQDYCTPPEDQGSTPRCAAYACAGYLENIFWRKNDYHEDIDPSPIYDYAKTIDGDPDGDGTTLTAVLQYTLDKGIFDPTVCDIRVLRAQTEDIKYALHKFGCALVGFNVTTEWYDMNIDRYVITGNENKPFVGGHAVLACGYDRSGLTIQNSWGMKWGKYGFATVTWNAVARQMLYGAVVNRCLDGFKMNAN